ncbi:MAG: glycosyltransferase family 2 protein [Verrucomicrobiales bacterium]|nr:glycosyltransferase family 2 protein [Verrucomicrobiales bacterium]
MNEPPVTIIMRSFNEAWALKDTLPALRKQNYTNWKLIVIDSGSRDGSQELIQRFCPDHFIEIPSGTYIPGRVLNMGMTLADTELCFFLNADATPQHTEWLRELVLSLTKPRVAATFGRQVPRPDCLAPFALDYERCFGSNRSSRKWDHFFSMVSSGIRRSIWKERRFREDLTYAEDDDYTRWCRARGYTITYAENSVVMHSHNYTPAQVYARALGDAKAISQAQWTDHRSPGWLRSVLLRWSCDIARDFMYCAAHSRLNEWPHAAQIRWHQRRGDFDGHFEGAKLARNTMPHQRIAAFGSSFYQE